MPYAVKDQFDTAGVRTTCGSRIMEHHVPAEDATTISRLNAAGGILLGKLNLTEFALGGTQQFPFGQPRNPWNLDHDPGGSSSGSGIAVAAGLCGVSLGEDTGGSVRSPASFCGVVGLRPTWSRVSRHGSFPLSWSMDTPGPLSRTVEDAAWLLQTIAGYDPKDPLSSREPVPDYARTLADGVRGLRVGIIRELTFGPETDVEVRGAVVEAARVSRAARRRHRGDLARPRAVRGRDLHGPGRLRRRRRARSLAAHAGDGLRPGHASPSLDSRA